MRVIGTAGHVDHGKSTLIAALTGIHPDRLKEEQEREMTIDLGFGWLTLPNGEEIGIVDVPGHRDFIENMLAGIGGIDAALLVVAADEGVMPQTREHLAILDLLQISAGIVVLTKIDMVSDPDWLDLVESDIKATIKYTSLHNASFVRVSAKSGAGLPDLLTTLVATFKHTPARFDFGRPRLPIDRVFSIAGFGTVVTGTLSDGHLNLGDEVEILPSGQKSRIRGLQTHKKKEETAIPGSRTAMNLSGVAVEQIDRGEVVIRPGQYQATRRLDAHFRLLADVSGPLHHASQVKVFIGTSETMATLRLLGKEILQPGEDGWLQLDLRSPVVAVRGDRYILRRPSPGETLGGGSIVDHQPKGRHKRFDEDTIKRLVSMTEGSPADILLQACQAIGAGPISQVVIRSRLEAAQVEEALNTLFASGQLIPLEDGDLSPGSDILTIASHQYNALCDRARQILMTYHRDYPLRRGIPREELKSRLKVEPRLFNALVRKMTVDGKLTETGSWVAQPGHVIRFDDAQQAKVQALLKRFAQNPYSPPSVKESQAEVGSEVFNALIELGEMTVVSPEVVFRRSDYEAMVARISEHIRKQGQVTVAQARDIFNTSRRFILSFLEYLDSTGITVRDGDYRRLRK
jgi:selenocysteine-specific elongation factor